MPMLHETFHDLIKVLIVFDGARVIPKAIRWQNNAYKITKVLNVHSTYDGRERIFFFSVATETEFFKLEFHTHDLSWYLMEHYQE